MSPRKLSDEDREQILDLYRTSEETTSTLAIRYGVSSSTISRFLKNNLSESEYEDLIQQKRLARTPYTSISSEDENEDDNENNQDSLVNLEIKFSKSQNDYTQLSLLEVSNSAPLIELESAENEQEMPEIEVIKEFSPRKSSPLTIKNNFAKIHNQIFRFNDEKKPLELTSENTSNLYLDDNEVLESLNILQEMFDDDLDVEDDEDDDLDVEDDDWNDDDIASAKIPIPSQVQILPLSEASFPRTCYLVIDRYADLITRPLKDFADLGDIPLEEVMQKTLPVFENHRVAKRFSNRRGKVIKVPDARILKKACNYLYAKGITRLLMDGKIYSLS